MTESNEFKRGRTSYADVGAVRELFARRQINCEHAADLLSVSPHAARKILSGETYRRAPGPRREVSTDGRLHDREAGRNPLSILSSREMDDAQMMRDKGMSLKEISEHFKVSRDCIKRGTRNSKKNPRARGGALCNQRKLTNEQAKEARELYSSGAATKVELSRRYGISIAVLGHLLRGSTYREAGGPIRKPGPQGGQDRALTDEQAVDAREKFHLQGYNVRQVAREFRISDRAMRKLLSGETYRAVGGPVGPVFDRRSGKQRASKTPKGFGSQVAERFKDSRLEAPIEEFRSKATKAPAKAESRSPWGVLLGIGGLAAACALIYMGLR